VNRTSCWGAFSPNFYLRIRPIWQMSKTCFGSWHVSSQLIVGYEPMMLWLTRGYNWTAWILIHSLWVNESTTNWRMEPNLIDSSLLIPDLDPNMIPILTFLSRDRGWHTLLFLSAFIFLPSTYSLLLCREQK
jgi:hypothetical protein